MSFLIIASTQYYSALRKYNWLLPDNSD